MCSRERNCICDSGVVGNARPCQGRDRGFEPRLSLYSKRDIQMDVSFLNEPHPGLEVRASPLRVYTSFRSFQSRHPLDVVKRSAQSRRPLDVLRPSIASFAPSGARSSSVSASRLHFVSVVSKPTSTGCRETVRAKPRSTGPRAPSIALTTKRIFERSLLSESIKKVTWGQQSQHIQYLST